MEVIILLSNIMFCTLTIKGTRDFKSIQTRLKCPLYSLFLVVAWAMMFVWLGNSTLLILRLTNIQSSSVCWHWTLNDQVFNSNILFETCKIFFFFYSWSTKLIAHGDEFVCCCVYIYKLSIGIPVLKVKQVK